MMNQIDIGTEIRQVLQGTIGGKIAKEIDQLIQNEKLTQLDAILILCNFFMKEINEQAIVETTQWGNLVAKSVTKKKNSRYTWKELMTYGARIIYLIRHLLIQDDISFLFGSTTSNGSTNTTLVSQMELMTHLEYVGKNKIGVHLSQFESNLNSIQTFSDALNFSNRINLWNQVFNLAKVDSYPGGVTKSEGKSLNAHQLYQKQTHDMKVHLTYHGTNHKKEYYYNINGSFKYFNFGWLWEWYNSILYGENNELYNKVTNQIQNNSIQGVILSVDSIPGTRQGDFTANVGNLHNQQVQAKFNNQTIISYNNIKVIMIQLTQALKEYAANNSQERKNKLMEVLSYHFIPDTVINVNQFANNIVQNLMNTIPKRI